MGAVVVRKRSNGMTLNGGIALLAELALFFASVCFASGCQSVGTTVKVELHRSDIVASVETTLQR